jgi:hypothetical protein
VTDADERALFKDAVRRAVDANAVDAAALDSALAALGWHDALAADARLAVSVLFECQGAANATSSAIGHVVGAGLGATGGNPVPGREPSISARGFVLPALGTWDPPGTDVDGRFLVRALGTATSTAAGTIVVPTRVRDGRVAVHTVPRTGLTLVPVRGLDPGLGLVTADMDASSTGGGAVSPGDWPGAVGLARMALGHELVGAAGAMLELARRHALDREQFGRPIAAFQAVRHRLADTLVAVEGARALLDAAWDDREPDTVAMAKATAGRAARVAARHAQQVLAGMGFTTEHPLHRYVRRVLVLDELFGSARALTAELGVRLAAGGPLPVPVPL